jgi:hypothetical protein
LFVRGTPICRTGDFVVANLFGITILAVSTLIAVAAGRAVLSLIMTVLFNDPAASTRRL